MLPLVSNYDISLGISLILKEQQRKLQNIIKQFFQCQYWKIAFWRSSSMCCGSYIFRECRLSVELLSSALSVTNIKFLVLILCIYPLNASIIGKTAWTETFKTIIDYPFSIESSTRRAPVNEAEYRKKGLGYFIFLW